MILFIGEYPEKERQREGMAQRILTIDQQQANEPRQYLFVSYRRFFRKEQVRISSQIVQYRCNLFLHFPTIIRLFSRAGIIYFHSVVYVLTVLPYLAFIPNKKTVILDLHGLPPEELALSGHRIKSKLYAFSERIILRRADIVIAVSRAMIQHFRQKYPDIRARYLVYGIVPFHLKNQALPSLVVNESPFVNIVYSGNTQSWQNIGLMCQLIRKNRFPNFRYYILTGEKKQMQQHLEAAGLAGDPSIHLETVSPDGLRAYYEKAHYGFILRDDIAINRVASPTKLIEYLYYGIIPIVKSPDLGDFRQQGYEYLPFSQLSGTTRPLKSKKNQAIAQKQLQENPLRLTGMISNNG